LQLFLPICHPLNIFFHPLYNLWNRFPNFSFIVEPLKFLKCYTQMICYEDKRIKMMSKFCTEEIKPKPWQHDYSPTREHFIEQNIPYLGNGWRTWVVLLKERDLP
jgi:hypothetical protein